MSSIDELNCSPCEKIDPWDINAFFELQLEDTTLTLDNSWCATSIDLTPAIKKGETITHLFLSPEDIPTALQFNREDYGVEGAENNGVDCIEGDDLSRIISMQLLKDVDINSPVQSGDVYMFNGSLFEPFALQAFVNQTNTRLTNLEGRMSTAEANIQTLTNRVNNHETRITALEQAVRTINTQISNINSHLSQIDAILARPSGIPQNVRLVWGNINTYGDNTNTNNHNSGLFTHSISNDITNDLYFA